ncbi:hypothetical protein L2089_15930 [Paenibacillus hunanensis]|uniref:homing endonuclease associated repeat-containing protein n=1 Tax=Paenibacillus hunanensis TaxID=539262 RepID=UPI00202750E5|nr:hypothetical protein [Paenibacillus hunanensis]MCL9662184.1 hypothetical protein [Paenibacillus hunanensis]
MTDQNEKIIQAVRQAAAYYNQSFLSMPQYKRYASKHRKQVPSLASLTKAFSTWETILQLAGLEKGKPRLLRCIRCGTRCGEDQINQGYCTSCMELKKASLAADTLNLQKKQEIIKSLQHASTLTNQQLSVNTYKALGLSPSYNTIIRSFGSWIGALKEAHIYDDNQAPVKRRRKYSDEALLQHLQHLYQTSALQRLSAAEYIKRCKNPSITLYKMRFGSWANALAAAGLSSSFSEEYIIQALQTAQATSQGKLTVQDYRKRYQTPSFSTIVRHYGSWSNALKAAGLDHTLSDENLIHILQTAAQQVSGKLTIKAYAQSGMYPSYTTFMRRFGSWKAALQTAGLQTKHK